MQWPTTVESGPATTLTPLPPCFAACVRSCAPLQGEARSTWLQAMAIGDVAVVGVPAEFFTKLGLDIKKDSPFPHTIVAELANDWIGYVPDREAFKLGGYQVWTGLHSWVAPGTGEAIVAEQLRMLQELRTQYDLYASSNRDGDKGR